MTVHAPRTRTSPARRSDRSSTRPESPAVVKRHSRALRILTCLQSGPSFNARELARRMQVSRRTIYRDLNLIRAAGIDVVFDEAHSAYRVDSHRGALAPLKLAPEDLTRLLVTSHLSPFSAMSEDFEVSVRESMARLLGGYPQAVRDPIQRIINCCRVNPSVRGKQLSDLLQRILVAVGRGVQLRIAAQRPGEPLEVSLFAPYLVEMDGLSWRVLGRSNRQRTRQVYRLEEIRSAELTDISYRIPRNNRVRNGAQQ